jgi:hypothetical protein
MIRSQIKHIQTLIKEENIRREEQVRKTDIRPHDRNLPKSIKEAQAKLEFLKNRKARLQEALLRNDISSRIGEVPWDFITFHNQYISIMPTYSLSLKIPIPESRESFNFIKNAIASRLEPIKIEWNASTAQIADQINFDKVLAYLVCKENLSSFFTDEGCDYRKYYDSIPAKLSHLFFPKSKTEYLNFLCEVHSPAYKIVPVQETLNNLIEDSFLFTVERSETVYIIWENTNISRATYVFRVAPEQYEERLQFVFDYIVSSIRAKRQRLHSDDIDKEIFGDFEIINHTDIEAWKERLMSSKTENPTESTTC